MLFLSLIIKNIYWGFVLDYFKSFIYFFFKGFLENKFFGVYDVCVFEYFRDYCRLLSNNLV